MPRLIRVLLKPVLSLALTFLAVNIGAEDSANIDRPAPALSYDRMYVDSDGVSHFGKGELPFSFQDYAPPANPIAIHSLEDAQGATLVFMSKGSFEDWHPAPRRQFAFILKGVVEVTVGDGEARQFGPGSVVLLEDTTGPGHTTRVVGDEDHLSVMVPVIEE
jgi:quercetin dioxygenase-like cupin family protein